VLKDAEAFLLLGESINGKNAEIREAQLRTLTKDQRVGLYGAEKEKRLAEMNLALALDARRNIENCLRVEELNLAKEA
jgi:hypothetical protein